MKRNRIRLTESQLDKVITEAIHKFAGTTLSADNPEDWTALEKIRDFRMNNSPSNRPAHEVMKDAHNSIKDMDNAAELLKQRTKGMSPEQTTAHWRYLRHKGTNKAIDMQRNLGWREKL